MHLEESKKRIYANRPAVISLEAIEEVRQWNEKREDGRIRPPNSLTFVFLTFSVGLRSSHLSFLVDQDKLVTKEYNSWLPVLLIKHVYYSMSSQQSAHFACQIFRVFCQTNNCSVSRMTRSQKILLHARCMHALYVYGNALQLLFSFFSAFLYVAFDMQMQVSSHSPAHVSVSHLHCLLITILTYTNLFPIASAAQSVISDDWDELYGCSITGSV